MQIPKMNTPAIQQRALIALLLTLCTFLTLFYCNPARADQQQSAFQQSVKRGYDAFSNGQIPAAVDALREALASSPNIESSASIYRDVLEFCTQAFLMDCYFQAQKELLQIQKDNSALARSIGPEIMIYIVQSSFWWGQTEFLQDIASRGGPSAFIDGLQFPGAFAEMQLAMLPYFSSKNDLEAARTATSAAVLGLLLTNRQEQYRICKIVVRILSGLVLQQDIVGAFQLLSIIDPYIAARLPKTSILYADYVEIVGSLLSYTTNLDLANTKLKESAELYARLDINQDIKHYHVVTSGNLRTAALALVGNFDEANKAHESVGTLINSDEIFARGYFKTYQEFYYAVADVFLSAVQSHGADQRWRNVFEKEPVWKTGDSESKVIRSYRQFALGCIALSEGKATAAPYFIRAANDRLSIFETFLLTNLDGFQLPSAIDKIVIGAGVEAAVGLKLPEAADLALKAGEVLLRGLRDSIADDSILLASQQSDEDQKAAHSFLNLVQQKRDWELRQIREFLAGDTQRPAGEIINVYTAASTDVIKLKNAFLRGTSFKKAIGLPTVEAVQRRLPAKSVLVTYFPLFTGFGRLCIGQDTVVFSTGNNADLRMADAKLLEFAVTGTYLPDIRLDSQFPVQAAVNIYNTLFDGLNSCMRPGSDVIVALPKEFSGVPLAALLREVPPARKEGGYLLKNASWLIKEYSFSHVLSGRQYLALTARANNRTAPFPYLGIGDPDLKRFSERTNLPVPPPFRSELTSLQAIPESSLEIQRAGGEFLPETPTILLDHEATEQQFRLEPLYQFDVIHFATHGLFAAEPSGLSDAALVLGPSSEHNDGLTDGLLSAAEISRLSLRARLVVLSSCNSAKYNIAQASLGVHDLQAAFTVAGASTVLASLWSVDSVSATELIVRFFKAWHGRERLPAAVALAEAMRTFLDSSDEAHQHPRFWAPFVVIGDPRISSNYPEQAQHTGLPAALKVWDGFQSGGEVIDSVRLGDNLAFSAMGDWDGHRMSSIISLQDVQRREKWNVRSKEVSAGRIVELDGRLVAAGEKGQNEFVPVLRGFDANGRLVWRKDFSDLVDYSFVDMAARSLSVFVIAYPTFQTANQEHQGYILELDRNGAERRRVSFALPTSEVPPGGRPAFVIARDDRLAVVVNSGYSLRLEVHQKSALGFSRVCFKDENTIAYYFSYPELKMINQYTTPGFRTSAVAASGPAVLIGGEKLDGCAQLGGASILKVSDTGAAELFWQDGSLFPGSVRGISLRSRILVAINYQRAVGLSFARQETTYHFKKLWADNDSFARDGAVVALDSNGGEIEKQDYSAGFGLFLNGVAELRGGPVAFGSVGGEPAVSAYPR